MKSITIIAFISIVYCEATPSSKSLRSPDPEREGEGKFFIQEKDNSSYYRRFKNEYEEEHVAEEKHNDIRFLDETEEWRIVLGNILLYAAFAWMIICSPLWVPCFVAAPVGGLILGAPCVFVALFPAGILCILSFQITTFYDGGTIGGKNMMEVVMKYISWLQSLEDV